MEISNKGIFLKILKFQTLSFESDKNAGKLTQI